MKSRHSALSRAESTRERRNYRRKHMRISLKTRSSSQGSHFSNQDQESIQRKKKTETFTFARHSDPEREKPFKDTERFFCQSAPGVKFSKKTLTPIEVNLVVKEARRASADSSTPQRLKKPLKEINRENSAWITPGWTLPAYAVVYCTK
ncbi:hypothetical protein PoB_006536800 [Plakobranchus ocellatus]|uniref:Uncharacterized protein n=1 Tax=Plakobranchus ocellatus TaxID=259542 RepID=A0AAV4D3V7_9GAST|nr:hypothetical protein PoB_006536800 [Plakobranchus ocellatus]